MRGLRRDAPRGEDGGAGVVDGGHPARLRRGRGAGDHQPGALRGLRGAAQVRPDADPRPLRGPGRRRDGCLCDGVPRRRTHRRRVGGGAVAAVGVPGAVDPGQDGTADDRRRPCGRARCAVLHRGELPRGAPRPRLRRRGAGTDPAAGPHGHRRVDPDAHRAGRRRAPPPRHHPLRAGRRVHRDLDRASGDLQPRDRRPPHRRGPARVAGAGGDRRQGPAGPRRPGPLRRHRRDPRRHRPHRAPLRRNPASRRRGGPVPVRRAAPLLAMEIPDLRRTGAVHAGAPPRPRRAGGLVRRSPPGGGSSSTRWSTRTPIRCAAPGARPC